MQHSYVITKVRPIFKAFDTAAQCEVTKQKCPLPQSEMQNATQ